MRAAFASGLAANRFQPLDLSRQGLQGSRPNPFDALSEKIESRLQDDFGLGEFDVQSLPGIVVRMTLQQVNPSAQFSPFGSFNVRVLVAEKAVPVASKKYI